LAALAPRTEWRGHEEAVFVEGQLLMRDMAAVTPMRPPGAYDPAARLRDLDEQGVLAELIFPSVALWIYRMRQPDLARACATVYNDWCSATFNAFSPRTIGVAALPALDTQDCVGELQRCADLGFRAVMLPSTAPDGRPYHHNEIWEPVWEAAAAAGVPVSFHIGTGDETVVARGPGGALINYVETTYPAMRVVSSLVSAGVLDRHPGLRVFVAEGGASWLPALADRLDEAFRQHGRWVRPQLSELPSHFIREQVYASFQHDKSAIVATTAMGYRNVMWGTDYPHLEGTWPNTQQVVEDLFADVPTDATDRICVGAFSELFGVDTAALRSETTLRQDVTP
jgi:predicted TIM-barrel fold metal-dependent hydrolase